jgi:predicted restriction endonuclease
MDTQNRLNPSNGLCLSALHDRAYDIGLMTVLPDLTIRVSKDLKDVAADAFTRDILAACDGRTITLPERFRPEPDFLAVHAKRFGYL